MKRTIFLITLTVAILLPLAATAAQVGTFSAVSGEVDIAGVDRVARPVRVGDPVDEGDVIRTKSDAKAEITFADANILRLAGKSRIVISEYVSTQESLVAKLTLSRGKVQNIVRKTGQVFGRIKKNRFEVHTPTAVVGVRGTNFFTYFEKGISGAAFLEGEGYGYNPRLPGQVELIRAGQALLIASTEVGPVTRDLSDQDLNRHLRDTAPQDDGAPDEGGTGDPQDDGQVNNGQAGGDQGDSVQGDGGDLALIDLADVVVDPRPEVQMIVEQIIDQQVVLATLPIEIRNYPVTSEPILVTLIVSPAAVTNSSTADFVLSVEGDTTTVYAYKIDDFAGSQPWFTTTDPAFSIANLSEGVHQIEFAAIDANGNRSVESVFSWETDYTRPVVVPTNTPAALTNLSYANIVPVSNETATYSYILDGIGVAGPNLTGLVEGEHSLTIIATDLAGNTGTTVYNWTTDYTPPDVLVLDKAVTSVGAAGSSIAINLGTSATDVAGYTWSLDQDTQTGTGSTVNLGGLVDGAHTLIFSSVDAAGNRASSSVTFDLYNQVYSGNVSGAGSVLTGTATGAFSAVLGDNWGNWQTTASGTYSGGPHSPDWQATSGGTIYDIASSPVGYWLERVDGTTSTSSLTALGETSVFTGTGTVAATFTPTAADSGDWQFTDTGSGNFTETPLTFSSGYFSGTLFAQESGTSYSGEFDRWNPTGGFFGSGEYDAHYGYEYFVGSGPAGILRFGSYYASEYMDGANTDRLFNYDGIIYDTGEHSVSVIGTWVPGTLTAADFNDPLALTWQSTPVGSTWEQRRYEEWASNLILETGDFNGILYGTGDLWNATSTTPATFKVLGSYANYATADYTSHIFRTGISSSAVGGGAFAGDFSGVFDETAGRLNGVFYGIYIAPDQSGGILTGRIDYNSVDNFLLPELGMYLTEGTIFPTMMTADVGLAPDVLGTALNTGIAGGWLAGSFGAPNSWFGSELGFGGTTSLRGQNDWGVFNLAFGWDNFLANPDGAAAATVGLSGVMDFGTHAVRGTEPIMADTGIFATAPLTVSFNDPATGLFYGDISGEYLTYTQMGEIGGQLLGSYDAAGVWQGVAAGYWQNGQTLTFNGDLKGQLVKMVESANGYYDNSLSNSPNPPTIFYSYTYETGAEIGWSEEKDTNTLTTITKDYHPDGTIDVWTNVNGAITHTIENFTPGTLAALITGWTPPGTDTLQPPTYSLWLEEKGHFSALLGSVADLWTADLATPANIHLLGEIGDDPYATGEATLISAEIGSVNPYQLNYTIWDQSDPTNPVNGDGAYMGLLTGVSGIDGAIDLTMQGLYVDQVGNVGILTGKVGGAADYLSEMWSGDGAIYPIELVGGTTIQPSELYPMADGGIVEDIREYITIYNGVSGGWFIDSGPPEALGSYITMNEYNSTSLTVRDPAVIPTWELGVQSTQYGGTYDSSLMGDQWRSYYEVMSMTGDQTIAVGQSMPNPVGWDGSEIGSIDTAGKWSNGEIMGKGAAAWVSIDDAMTGVSGADLQGTFNPTNTTWQMAAAWANIDTNTFLTMTATTAGKTALAQLNIPCIEVGRTTLSGSSTVFSDVHINDATFFAYSTGADPTLWASGDVGGSYVSLPVAGDFVALTGAEGLSADFMVNSWAGSTWNATVWGWGTYLGPGTMNGRTIDFNGFAAGRQSGSPAGSFTGTGSGLVAPTVNGAPIYFGGGY